MANVLVVEDDADVRELMVDALALIGYSVDAVGSAELGLEYLTEATVDCVLCDLNLPGMDGIAFSTIVSEANANLPVVLITGVNDVETARTAIKCGAADYITKPVTIDGLAIIVERNIERSKQANTSRDRQRVTTQFRVIQALAGAIDAKQSYTAQHSVHVAELAELIGHQIGLSDPEIVSLSMASLVHDVGKISVPDQILNKPGPLLPYEWTIMKTHAEKGASIVAKVPELSEVATVVLHHHERVDGSGYPMGLRDKEIPYLSKIIAVADAYDCMTSERTYRSALSAGEAIRRIQEASGLQFDRGVVQAIVSVKKEHT